MTTTQTATRRDVSESFSTELATHIPALRNFAKTLTRDSESASDLAQETLAKAWQARSTFIPGTNLKAWLFVIMRNLFRSERRRAWRQVPWDQSSAERVHAPDDQQTWSMELEDTARAIVELSPRQREALILAGLGGFSAEDAGAIMRCRSTAVKNRVCRARQAVTSMLNGTMRLRTHRNNEAGSTMGRILHELEQLKTAAA